MEVIGIDIGKRKFDLAWKSGSTGKIRNKVFDNTSAGHEQLLAWLDNQNILARDTRVAMEATGQYYESVAQVLFDAGFAVIVANPNRVKAFGMSKLQRQKTDKADANLIARFCEEDRDPIFWSPPSGEVRELQRLVARLEAVQGMHVQEQNRRHESQGVTLESVDRMLGSLRTEEDQLKKMIHDHIDQHPSMRHQKDLLCSIPGVGERLCSYFLAWLPFERFSNSREAVAFIGLSPQHKESGTSVRGKSRTCKLGHGRLRKILYMPAMTAMRFNPAALVLSERMRAAGKGGKVVVVAVMRKLVHWMVGVLKSDSEFDSKLALARP